MIRSLVMHVALERYDEVTLTFVDGLPRMVRAWKILGEEYWYRIADECSSRGRR